MSNKLLGERLVQKGCITQEQLDKALKDSPGQEDMLGNILISKGLLKEEELLKVLAEQFDLPFYARLKDAHITNERPCKGEHRR